MEENGGLVTKGKGTGTKTCGFTNTETKGERQYGEGQGFPVFGGNTGNCQGFKKEGVIPGPHGGTVEAQ